MVDLAVVDAEETVYCVGPNRCVLINDEVSDMLLLSQVDVIDEVENVFELAVPECDAL